MTNPLAWVVVGVTCASMWGVGYSFLAPASGIFKPSTLNIVYGFLLFSVALFVNVVQDDVTNLFEMAKQPRMGASVILYITLFMAASWLQLWGYKLIDGNTGPYNAICSCYPMINLLISYLFFGQKNVNWWYVLPGMLLIMTGVTVLAVAPPVVSSNGTDTPVNGAPTAGGNMAGQTDDTNKP